MTPLRRNLEQARRDYRADRYPGDLAAELLGVGPAAADAGHDPLSLDGGPIPISRGTTGSSGSSASRWRALFMPMALSAGIAAALAVGLTLLATGVFGRHDEPNPSPTIARNDGTPAVTVPTVTTQQPTKTATLTANANSTAAEQSSFSVVPAVASSDESYSIVPAAPSFDFDLSATETATTDSTAGSRSGGTLRSTQTQLN